ncbi:MAG TPA: hypothetical protein VE553_07260 [Candidatus Binatia bacterium]|nr:hypothetical protein [Candidatus Binatia bacterium]
MTPEAEMSPGQWIISAILGLLIVAAGVALFVWLSGDGTGFAGPADNRLPAAPEVAGQSAKEAYERAFEAAGQWAGDAQLITASATWAGGTLLDSGDGNWGFRFYSATQQSTALFAVTGAEAHLIGQGPASKTLAPLNIAGWLVDSPEVIATVMANGGKEFSEAGGNVSLTLTLNLVEEFQWQARLVNSDTNKVFTTEINPTSGEIGAATSPDGEA